MTPADPTPGTPPATAAPPAAVPAAPAPVSIEQVRALGLKVGIVESVQVHPKADRLYVASVRVGPGEVRQIVAGIRQNYTPDALIGRRVIVVGNLKPALLRGVESQGMILAASADGVVSLLGPDREIPAGAPVT